MDFLKRALEKFFAQTARLQERLSTDWREHTNRRTVTITLVVGLAASLLYIFVIEPPETFPTDQLVSIPAGASLKVVAQTLSDDGVIKNAFAFRMIVTVLGREHSVHAGDYVFKQPEDIFSIARAITIGAYGLEPLRIRIPEGATMKQMATIYSTELVRFNASNFLSQTSEDEGYLFPDTYFFLPNATETTVIDAMRQNFNDHIATVGSLLASSTHSLSDIVTMASIVEKEAGSTQDREMIAGVLWHRLALGMPLQSDVTLVYETGKPDSQLTIQDLQSDSPFNTYTHKGLPPTPVDSPSLDSIEASADPIASPYLYYLADKNGVTHYAKTYAQQLRNERLYLGQ